ncbi:MAG TPA: hypothetical protein VFU22_22690, partial [Roseiflexaceae bacterium]|nr:hypothetical protein [Roseiflexaceae bacterium]
GMFLNMAHVVQQQLAKADCAPAECMVLLILRISIFARRAKIEIQKENKVSQGWLESSTECGYNRP